MADTVFTIGYEGTDIRSFTTTLKVVGVEVLADVRAVSVSRKPGFSKKALAENLAAVGIEYQHFVDLGDPKPGRDAARRGDFDVFRSVYGAHLSTDQAQLSLQKLAETLRGRKVCLMCFERDPATCHRRIVAKNFEADGVRVIDLFGDDPERYERHRAILQGSGGNQSPTTPE